MTERESREESRSESERSIYTVRACYTGVSCANTLMTHRRRGDRKGGTDDGRRVGDQETGGETSGEAGIHTGESVFVPVGKKTES